MSTPPEITERFTANIGRVKGLVAIYQQLAGVGPGRPTVQESDLLRAAVLLLHAALEDLLRSVEELRLPTAAPGAFDRVPLPDPAGNKPRQEFTLVHLASYRGQTVDEVFRRAVDAHLERSNYNNIAQVLEVLARVGIPPQWSSKIRSDLAAMMKRRHWIAHRADRNPIAGRGQHTTQSLGSDLVNAWSSTIEIVGKDILARL